MNWQFRADIASPTNQNTFIQRCQRIVAGSCAVLAFAALQSLGALTPVEAFAYRLLFTLRGSQSWDQRLVIVAIDETTATSANPRQQYAQLLEQLALAQPRLIVLDVLMSENHRDDSLSQLLMAQKIPVVMAMAWDPQGNILLPSPRLRNYSQGEGHVLRLEEQDGITRKIPVEISGFPALGLASAQLSAAEDEVIKLRATSQPLWINWSDSVTTLATYQATEVLKGQVPASNLQDKIVLIGATVAGFDPMKTPFDVNPPANGIHLHAAVISNLLQDNYLRSLVLGSPFHYRSLLLYCLGGPGLSLVIASWRLRSQLITAIGLCSVWGIVCLILFQVNYLLPVASPMILVGITIVATVLHRQWIIKAKLRQSELHLWQQKFVNPLTGLPRRVLLLQCVEEAIEQSQAGENNLFALLLFDLDNFGTIKQCFGYAGGEQLLVAIARRLKIRLGLTSAEHIQENEQITLAHLDVDRFAIFLNHAPNFEQVIVLTKQVEKALSAPFLLEGQEIFSNFRIGIADSTTLLNNEQEKQKSTNGHNLSAYLLRNAEIALFQAKMNNRSSYAVFQSPLNPNPLMLLQLEADLRRSVQTINWSENNYSTITKELATSSSASRQNIRHLKVKKPPFASDFCLHYQPIVNLKDGKIIGFEGLVRWQHPTRGLISPLDFISLAEKTGLIGHLGKWVLREACTQMRAWQKKFPHRFPLNIIVNLSPMQLTQLGVISEIESILQQTGLDSSYLKLEVTESSFIEDLDTAMQVVQAIHALGIKLSIDDFGTGYSSLERLHNLPFSTVKIDRSFLSGMNSDKSRKIIQAIITLAHSLSMDVVAEGIITKQQWQELSSMGCDYGQGFFFSKAVDAIQATSLLIQEPLWE